MENIKKILEILIMKQLSEYTLEELQEMLKKLRWQYEQEEKPLYKRHIGGKMLTILQEIKKRK